MPQHFWPSQFPDFPGRMGVDLQPRALGCDTARLSHCWGPWTRPFNGSKRQPCDIRFCEKTLIHKGVMGPALHLRLGSSMNWSSLDLGCLLIVSSDVVWIFKDIIHTLLWAKNFVKLLTFLVALLYPQVKGCKFFRMGLSATRPASKYWKKMHFSLWVQISRTRAD